ncbi:unnamed protein product [Acanthoscelides obtectus]|uniref:Uncharacterized protein n=1 Tax=Acanthoscelides obtectus TaxID=200917 RepID=A0A9P0KH03_ACAOB|nr:unnamed protein product [Acanthoscelides obtectus]CAK1661639.1 hypothetical protein AOBTE_LOCUS22728 [Acanthoscelides obtectus]
MVAINNFTPEQRQTGSDSRRTFTIPNPKTSYDVIEEWVPAIGNQKLNNLMKYDGGLLSPSGKAVTKKEKDERREKRNTMCIYNSSLDYSQLRNSPVTVVNGHHFGGESRVEAKYLVSHTRPLLDMRGAIVVMLQRQKVGIFATVIPASLSTGDMTASYKHKNWKIKKRLSAAPLVTVIPKTLEVETRARPRYMLSTQIMVDLQRRSVSANNSCRPSNDMPSLDVHFASSRVFVCFDSLHCDRCFFKVRLLLRCNDQFLMETGSQKRASIPSGDKLITLASRVLHNVKMRYEMLKIALIRYGGLNGFEHNATLNWRILIMKSINTVDVYGKWKQHQQITRCSLAAFDRRSTYPSDILKLSYLAVEIVPILFPEELFTTKCDRFGTCKN